LYTDEGYYIHAPHHEVSTQNIWCNAWSVTVSITFAICLTEGKVQDFYIRSEKIIITKVLYFN